MKRPVAYYIVRGIMNMLGSLPLGFHLAMGRFVAWLMCSVLGYRRDTIMTNISRSFPDKKYDDLVQIRKGFYSSLGNIIGEAIWFGAGSYERVRKQGIVRILNPEVLQVMLAASPSVIVLNGHFGNWELSGGITAYDYVSDERDVIPENAYCVIHKALSSRFWEEIFHANRISAVRDKEHFEGYIESMQIVRYIFTHKSEKKVYNFINDQSPYSSSTANVDLEFMHQKTRTMTAAASIAHKLGFAVIYSGMKRVAPGKYTLEYVPVCEDASKVEVSEITRKYYALLQKDIEDQPDNYLWSHKRWKHKI